MRQDKPVQAVRRVGTRGNNDSARQKAIKRQKDFRTSTWYEKAASSIKAAPSRV